MFLIKCYFKGLTVKQQKFIEHLLCVGHHVSARLLQFWLLTENQNNQDY
jgi:hypothetical protein